MRTKKKSSETVTAKPAPRRAAGFDELLHAVQTVLASIERVEKKQALFATEIRGIRARVDGLGARIDALTADTRAKTAALEATQLTLERMVEVLETRVQRLRDSVIPQAADEEGEDEGEGNTGPTSNGGRTI